MTLPLDHAIENVLALGLTVPGEYMIHRQGHTRSYKVIHFTRCQKCIPPFYPPPSRIDMGDQYSVSDAWESIHTRESASR